MMFRLFFAIALLCTVATTGWAQSISGLMPTEAETEAVDDDLQRLLDAAQESGRRIIILDESDSVESASNLTDPDSGDSSALMRVQQDAASFREALVERLTDLPGAFEQVAFVLRATSPNGTIMAYVMMLVFSSGLFLVGMLAERYIYGPYIARSYVVSRIQRDPKGYREKVPFLIFRYLAGIIGVLFSMLVAYVLGYAIFGPLGDASMQFTATLINIGYFAARMITGTWRMILSPFLPQYRIPILDDREARRLYRWLSTVTIMGVANALLGVWLRELGLIEDVYTFVSSATGLLITLLNIALVISNRGAVTKALRGGLPNSHTSLLVRILTSVWLPVSIFYFIFGWFDVVWRLVVTGDVGVPLPAAGYAILTAGLVVYGLINYGIERSFARFTAIREMNERMQTDPSVEMPKELRPAMRTYQELARRVAGILGFVAAIAAFNAIWRPDINMGGPSGFDRLVDIVVIIFIGYIVFHAFRIWIDGKIAEEQADTPEGELGDEGGASSASRLATLLPLFRSFVMIVIFLSIGFIILMELGVNVSPLFAGAGIIGVAVGFGSQSLVRDIFSGAFFLFDDAFRKGEYIDVGGVKGTVERISVRSFQLRHHLGALHTIPFGEIQVLTNYSRDWVIMKLPLRVTYDTDVEKVRKLIKKLGQSLLDDPVIGDNFIQPLKSQGVIEMQDSAMIIRVKFMTKPGDQWLVRKKVYEEIRQLFEREGIKFAHREVTVRLADGKRVDELSDEERREVVAASRDVIEEEMPSGGTFDDDR